MGNTQHVGIAEMIISEDPDAVIAAPNLGSCLGISVYDPKRKVGGIIHCLLPLSKADPEKAKSKPFMYVDTGMVELLSQFINAGSDKKDLQICVAGGAHINDASKVFEIGKKNFTVFRKFLWKNNLLIQGEDIGENFSRTISLHVGTGEVWLKSHGEEKRLN